MSARGDRQPILSNAVASGSNGRGGSLGDICWFASCTVRIPPERPGREAYRESKQQVTGKHSAEFPNMAQRAVMQCLSLDDWKIAARLPIPAGELMLSRIRNYGWIEIRGEKQHTAIKLTSAELKAMRSGHLKPAAGS
jgi:hypothetical protein